MLKAMDAERKQRIMIENIILLAIVVILQLFFSDH
jgi:hypothetical protein